MKLKHKEYTIVKRNGGDEADTIKVVCGIDFAEASKMSYVYQLNQYFINVIMTNMKLMFGSYEAYTSDFYRSK